MGDGALSMDYNVSFRGHVVIVGGEVNCFDKEVLADGRIELFYVETDETRLFSIDLNQLITAAVFFYWCKFCFFSDCAVDAVRDLFAEFVGLMSVQLGLIAKFGL